MVLKIVVAVAAVVVAILVFAATKPSTIRVQRSIVIQAAPEKVFALIDDFHMWKQWEPQDTENPTMTRTFDGAASGKGAVSNWSGSGNAGKGRMEISESVAPSKVTVVADWEKPFAAHNVNEFVLETEGAGTKVTWTINGTNVYMMKVMSVFLNMDRFMGKHFESGLGSLKSVAEKP
jgi:uncharacterized protein YndB with AHSA1/START domain